jgi:hypothetical protein
MAGGGRLGAVLGLVLGAVISIAIASPRFHSDVQAAESRISEARERRDAAKKPASTAKEFKEEVLVGVGNAGADALSPLAEASFYWSFKVIIGSIAGLIVGTILGLMIMIFIPGSSSDHNRNAKAGPA